MICWFWKNLLLIISVASLVVMGLLAWASTRLTGYTRRLGNTMTCEVHLLMSPGAVGFVAVTDPTGYAIPFLNRGPEVIKPEPFREVSSVRIPYTFVRHVNACTNGQENPVVIRTWSFGYIPLAVLAGLVVVAHGAVRGYKRASLLMIAARARRQERLYPSAPRCPACGYDVRENIDRCPECGQAFVRHTVILAKA